MPLPRNPNNQAIEIATRLGKEFLEYVKQNYPEPLGQGPLPERQRRIGPMPANPIIDVVAGQVPEEM